MICVYCGSEMGIVDFDLPDDEYSDYDRYWFCDCCHASAEEKSNYGFAIFRKID